MKIAVNTQVLSPGEPEGSENFRCEVLKRIAKNHPDHEFLFIVNRSYDKNFLSGSNITPVMASLPRRSPLLWKWWYNVKIPAILKKYSPDVLLSFDRVCSLATQVPQCIVVNDLSIVRPSSLIERAQRFFCKRYGAKSFQKAAAIATVSAFLKKEIIARYNTREEKIQVVYSAVKEIFRPVQEQEATRQQYAGGKNYFVYSGAMHSPGDLVHVLKAFSVFKKRQQSNWKLVITARLTRKSNDFTKALQTYRYRDDIVLAGETGETERAKITGSAYALIYLSPGDGAGLPVLEALCCGVPVITSGHSAMEEIAGDAALYAGADYTELADKMMLLYKDEMLRGRLIEKGKQRASLYSWDQTADLLWQSILKCKG